MLSWTIQYWAILLTANSSWAYLFLLCQQLMAAPSLGVWVLGVMKSFAQSFSISKGKTEVTEIIQMSFWTGLRVDGEMG